MFPRIGGNDSATGLTILFECLLGYLGYDESLRIDAKCARDADVELQILRTPITAGHYLATIPFGAREAMIFSKQGSVRSGSQYGSSFNSP